MKMTAIVTVDVPASEGVIAKIAQRQAEMEAAGDGKYFHRQDVKAWVAEADAKLPGAVSAAASAMKGWKRSREDVGIFSGGPDAAPYHQFQTYWSR